MSQKYFVKAKIIENHCVSPIGKIFRLQLALHDPSILKDVQAGQFLQVKVNEDKTLLRPFAMALMDTQKNFVTIFYKVVGEGTDILSQRTAGDCFCLLPLGKRGFRVQPHSLLVGGGMGNAPLLSLAQSLSSELKKSDSFEKNDLPDILIAGRNKDEIDFWIDEFTPFVHQIFIATDDGSLGQKGVACQIVKQILETKSYANFALCGPEIMMKTVYQVLPKDSLCEISLERRMACGLGSCLACSIDLNDGSRKKVCADGTVFDAKDYF